MKKAFGVFIGSLFVSSIVLAASQSDRVDFGDDVFGIKHTENFEYVCNMQTIEQGKPVEFKAFLDVDFSTEKPYRFAVGFVGGGSLQGIVAAEASIASSAKGRCPGLCLALTLQSQDGETGSVLFSEDSISKVISVQFKEQTDTVQAGTCTKNEVE